VATYNAHIPSGILHKVVRSTMPASVPGDGNTAAGPVGACDRILKVARTIADLEGAYRLGAKYVAEAAQYGSLDSSYSGQGTA